MDILLSMVAIGPIAVLSVPQEPPALPTLQSSPAEAPAPVEFSLEGFLADSLHAKHEAELVKEGRKAIAKGALAGTEKTDMERLLRSWEVRREWNVVASTILFSRQLCSCCGQYTTQFQGFYQRQQHKTNSTQRWVASSPPAAESTIPKESKYEDSVITMCEDCAEADGWEVEE